MSTPVHQCICGLDGRFFEVSDGYAAMLGATPRDLTTRHMLDVTHPDDRDRNIELLDRLITHGDAFELTKRYRRLDGTTVWVRNHVSTFADGIGGRRVMATCRPLDPDVDTDPQARWRRAGAAGRLFRAGRAALGDLVMGSVAAELLLLLYRIEAEGRAASVRMLGTKLDYPPALVRRWLAALIDLDCVVVAGGAAADDADAAVSLSRRGFTTIELLMTAPLVGT